MAACLRLCRGLLQDPLAYPDPTIFSPERHLKQLHDGTWELRTDVPDPRKYAFGFGRRACPGVHIAEQSLFATITTLLHTIDIVRAKDSDGVEMVPEVQVASGLLAHTLPFPYELRMRPDAHELVDMCIAAADI
jgi:cytochrome P450